MKILSLYFKNLNSLEGESRIDFQQMPLANAGVFAIVGPNGSGKSTVLDAISLAFYGETFRFDRPAEHVMTAYTTESFAQVEFALGERKFRTRWQVQRQENELEAPQMQLTELNATGDKILEQTSQDVCKKITEIIGMDFRNFSRSIMLAQGDFASFLNALDSERMNILEKMSSHDIYEAHKKELRDTTVAAQILITKTQHELTVLPLLDSLTLEATEHDLIDFKEQVSEFKLKQNQIREQLAWAKNSSRLKSQLQNIEKSQRQTKQQIEKKKVSLDKIATLQSALAFKENVTAINAFQEQITQSNKTCNNYKLELNQLKNQLAALGISANANPNSKNVAEQKQSIDTLKHQVGQLKLELSSQTSLQQALNKQINEKQAIQTATLRWLENHSGEKSLLEHFPETARLRALREEITELDARQQRSAKKFKASNQALKKNTAGLAQAKTKCLDYGQQIIEAENEINIILENNSSETLESLLVYQQQRVVDFDELYSLARVNQKVSATGFLNFFAKKSSTEEDVDIAKLQHEADDLTDQIAQAENIRNTLEQAVLNEVLIQRLRHERPHLVDDKPCPLCGALQHPFSKILPKEADSRQALTNQKIRLENLRTRANVVTKQIATAQKYTENTVAKNLNLEKVRFEFNVLSNKLNVGNREFTIKNLSGLKKLLHEEHVELSKINNLLKRHQQQKDKIAKLKLHIEKEQAIIVHLEQQQEQLTRDIGNLPQELQTLETSLINCQADEKIVAEKVLEQLVALGEVMPNQTNEEILVDRLTARRREYYTHILRDKALTDELDVLMQKATANQQKIEQNDFQFKTLSELLQNEESAGLQLALVEKQKIVLEQEQLYTIQQQELHNLQQTFEEKLVGTPFTNFKQVTEALNLCATQASLQQQVIGLEKQLERFTIDLEKTQAQWVAEQAQAKVTISEMELEAQHRSISEKLAIVTEEVRHYEDKLRKQVGYQEKQQVLSKQLAEQQQQFAELEQKLRLSEVNGMAFRRQVQLKMIAILLTQTNKMLEKISGRYYLRQIPTEQGLALEIEDTLQHNVRRLPKSLSGGETFVISLALALGLSELANNGKAVDSLFLDEGFGSLDAEVLNTVVNTLQSLQIHGKTIGVISHVDAVKKRIKTRIEMVKKPNGLSQLKKVS